MTKRKPLYFMKRKGKGYIRVWQTRGKGHVIKQAWSDGSIMVLENQDEFPMISGNYKFEESRNIMVLAGKNFPSFSKTIPTRKGYKEAKPLEKNGHLCLERIEEHVCYQTMVVELRAGEIKTLLDLEYFDYLEDSYGTSPCIGEWRIKDQNEPILFLWDGEIKAVIMPIKGYGDEE